MPSLIEILAVVSTLICIYLTIKNNVHCWWVGIVSNFLYFSIFLDRHIYADMTLQLVFAAQGAWSWWMWVKPSVKKFDISKLSFGGYIDCYLTSVFMWAALVPILIIVHGSNPPVDALVATFSIIGIYLTGKRKIESWHFWILTDIIAIIFLPV